MSAGITQLLLSEPAVVARRVRMTDAVKELLNAEFGNRTGHDGSTKAAYRQVNREQMLTIIAKAYGEGLIDAVNEVRAIEAVQGASRTESSVTP